MESRNLEMNDLFDTEVGVEDDFDDVGVAGMPGLDDEADDAPMNEEEEEEEGMADEEEGEGGDVLAKLRALKRGAAKKRVLRPQPKLDGSRLQGDRGLAILPKLFETVKFKGRGHEAHDLKLMMSKLEHWGHRLFPKMTFDELISRMEKLGQKKEVQTCLKRIRLDMPVLDDQFVSPNMYDSDDNNEQPIAGAENQNEEDFDAEEAYDEMIRQEREAMLSKKRQEEEEEEEEMLMSQSATEEMLGVEKPDENEQTPNGSALNGVATPASKGLSSEQMERIQRSKMKALEKRAMKLGVPVSSLMPNAQSNSEARPAYQSVITAHEDGAQNSTQTQPTPARASLSPQQNESDDPNILTQNETAATAQTKDIYQTEEEALKVIASDEENIACNDATKPEVCPAGLSPEKATNQDAAGRKSGDFTNREESLNLVLTESEKTESTNADNLGNLVLSCTESGSTFGAGSLKSDTCENSGEAVGNLKLTSSAENVDISMDDEGGLCLQLSDSTNTTQEEDDVSG